jgi:hypothetical protein
MAELQIDDDWKRQAQEEKRRLAEEAEKRRQSAQAPVGGMESAAGGAGMPGAAPGRGAEGGTRAGRGGREMPEASFGSIVQSIMTQALYYLGELAAPGGEGGVNLDMAKHQVDVLGILEQKTKGNLAPDEQRLVDAALYETRMRFVSVASQYVNPY